ncbi:catabolic L-serine/threonine dehydratase [Dimargaris xerosporica]|nr:catabolic L-serine/threonine dehydratase [Dimargaris xerosporica]
MAANDPPTADNLFHVPTPLLHSTSLSQQVGCNVWLKCENLQPSGSVKIRGMGLAALRAVTNAMPTQLVTASTGNAAVALAYVGRQLNRPAIVFVPQDTPAHIVTGAKHEGATVTVGGSDLEEAMLLAQNYAEQHPGSHFIHPFDDADVQQGYATLVSEIKLQLGHQPPEGILLGVGGGGLLAGVLQGLDAHQWNQVPAIAVETHGSNAFQSSRVSGQVQTLDACKTLASSLRSKRVTLAAISQSTSHPVIPFSVSDPMAANACRLFADEHRFMVEPACGAVLSLIYSGVIRDVIPNLDSSSNIVIILAGGMDITVEQLNEFRCKYSNPPIIVKSGSEIYMRLANDTDASKPAK